MNKEALTRHEIYSKLIGFSEKDLYAIVSFIDFMRYKSQLETKKLLRLEGILKEYDIDFTELKQFRAQTWRHLEQELDNG